MLYIHYIIYLKDLGLFSRHGGQGAIMANFGRMSNIG